MRSWPAGLFLLLLIGGCGYHVQGRGNNLPADVRTVFVSIFTNSTLEPQVETVVSRSVIDRLIRGRFLRVVDEPIVADSLLSGQVTAYTSTPIAYGRDDEISRYISQMSVSAWLRRSTTNEVIWQGAISWSEEYSASQNRMVQEDNEAAAIHTIGERIAEELYSRLGDNF